MGYQNQHGLGRTVPEGVKREVRQRCGYGCVICGLAYYDYEHFDPDFKDAKEHNPNGMTLLCMQCNQKRARGTLSRETVAKANASPFCKQSGFASEVFDFAPDGVEVALAGMTFWNCATLVQVKGLNILSFRPPEAAGGPLLLSGFFADSTGAVTLKVQDNVWTAGADNWDVEVVGPVITIRRGPGDIALALRVEPPRRLVVERLDMQLDDVHIRGNRDVLEVSPDGRSWIQMTNCGASDCEVGISLG